MAVRDDHEANYAVVRLYAGPPTRGAYWADVWRHRELTAFFAWRDFRVRYRQAVLGVGWALARPLLLTAAFVLVFRSLGKVEVPGSAPYGDFALCGLVAWSYFATVVLTCSEAVVANANLVGKVYFPRLCMPFSAVLAAVPDFLMGCAVLVGALVLTDVSPHRGALLLPAAVLSLAVAGFGVGAWLAALNVRYRDVRQLAPFAIQIGLFLSPVTYASTSLPARARALAALNPAAAPIDLFRAALLDTPLPAVRTVVTSIAVGLALSASATEYFRRREQHFADVI